MAAIDGSEEGEVSRGCGEAEPLATYAATLFFGATQVRRMRAGAAGRPSSGKLCPPLFAANARRQSLCQACAAPPYTRVSKIRYASTPRAWHGSQIMPH